MLAKFAVAIVLLLAALSATTCSQAARVQPEASPTAVVDAGDRRKLANITYLQVENTNLKLDIYQPNQVNQPTPTLIYIHGGGWIGGSKEEAVADLEPYLAMGWSVVNIQYRLAPAHLAPAAVKDTRCALRWVIKNAKKYNFDSNKVVLAGFSAGGHLALITGMLPASTQFDRQCPGQEKLKVAAIINVQGITDVADLLAGTNQREYAVKWLGNQPNQQQIAKSVSPINYVRPGLPPILTIHGDADSVVPYSHAVRLHQALTKAGVANQLLTIPGAEHGRFSAEINAQVHKGTREFLVKHNLSSSFPNTADGTHLPANR